MPDAGLHGRRRSSLVFVTVLLAGCGSSAPVDPAKLEAEQQRLLGPYTQRRAVVADRLEIDISPNFNHEVTRPAVHPQLHQVDHKKESGWDEYRWRNIGGGLQHPLEFRIGETGFAALQEAVLRVHTGRTELRLSSLATGNVDLQERGPSRKLSEVRIADGVLQGR